MRFENKKTEMKKNPTKSQQKKESALPVMKFDYNFNVIYSNTQAKPILNQWNTKMKGAIPTTVLNHHPEFFISLKNQHVTDINLEVDGTMVRCSIVPFPEAGYIGVYGYMVEYTETVNERASALRMN